MNDTTRRYPRTLKAAFPDTHDWADPRIVSHVIGAKSMRPDPRMRLIRLDTSLRARLVRILRRIFGGK